jgi:outer membrane receptor protein involved in Fe transport
MNSQTTTTGDVAGVVRDITAAVVPNATVTLRDVDTGALRNATTGNTGRYQFSLLKPGNYEISASSPALKSDLARIVVSVGQESTVNLVAKLQTTQQVIEVSAAVALIDVESPNLGTVITTHEIENLPMPGGDITSVVFSTPGVAVSFGSGYGNFSVHGLPGTSNLFTINGNDYNDAYLNLNNSGASNLLLGGNEIEEAVIVLNPYSVQYGRQAGAQINYTTKSGTNRFHANLLWNWNGDRLNANPFFNNANGVARPRAVSNQYGASLGGPVKKDKLFFFVDTEGIRYALPTSGYVTIPSHQLQAFVLQNVSPAQLPLYQSAFKYWNNAPGAAGAVPVTNGSGNLQDSNGNMGCGDLTGTAAPSGGVFGTNVSCASAWAANGSNLNTEWLFTARADYNINDRHRIYFRFKEDHGLQPTATSLISPVFNVQSLQPSYEGQINYSWILSPRITNNIVASASWYSAFFGSPDLKAAVAAFPVNFFMTDGGSNGSVGFTQMGLGAFESGQSQGFQFFPQGRNVGQWQITDDLAIVRGRHTLKFGVNFRKDRITDSSLLEGIYGQYNFSSLTDFATGQLNNGSDYTQSFPEFTAAHIRYYSMGLYAQDEWAVRPNFKITAGIRYEQNSNPSCVGDCFARLNNQFSSPAFEKGVNIPYNQSIDAGLSNAYPSTQAGVFEPRFGAVWSPKGTNGTVFRAGVGLFSDLAPAQLVYQLFTNAPNSFTAPVASGSVNTSSDPTSAAAVALNSSQAFRSGFAQGYTLAQLNSALSAVGGFSPPQFFDTSNKILLPKYLEWSFEIQQPLGAKNVLDVTYTGNHGRDLLVINPAVNAFGLGSLPAQAPDARFSNIMELTNGGISNYDGLTVAFRRALSYGLKGEIGYTWSHSLDDLSSQLGEPYNATSNNLSQVLLNTPYGPKFNYSNSDYDIRHNLTADFLWDLPFKPGKAWLRSIVGGWTLSSKFYLRSGVPFSVYDLNEAVNLVAQNVATQYYNGLLATTTSPNVGRNCGSAAVATACMSTSQFVAAGSETDFGNVPRNSFRGPALFDWDGTIYKSFTIHESMHATIGATAYNLTNHANFDTPSGDISAPGLGLITSTVSAPTSAYGAFLGSAVSGRIVVMTAKFQF